MKIDEAINILKQYIDYDNPNVPDFYTMEEAIKVIIEALEQEPCGDCISRQAVNELVDELARAISDERCCISRGRSTATIMRDIRHLPSVTAQPKMGRWIEHFDQIWKWYECDQCHTDWGDSVNYCPNCGSKMYEIPTGQIAANGELYPGEFDDPLAEEGSEKECMKNI